MGSQPPYRMPCEAAAGKPRYFLGGPFNHGLAPVLVDNNVNTTIAPNPISGTNTTPYTRGAKDISQAVGCEVFGNCESPNWGPCQQWPRPFAPNTFQKQGQTNFAVQHKRGFKAVQARRYWNGRFSNVSAGPDNVVGCPELLKVIQWQSYQPVPDRKKYQQIAVNAQYSKTWVDFSSGSPVTTTSDSSIGYTQTLDPKSGVFTINDWSFNPNSYDPGASEQPQFSNQAIFQTSFAYWRLEDAVNRFTTILSDTSSATVTFTSNSITVAFGGVTAEFIIWNINVGGTSSFDRNLYDFDNQGNPILVFHEHADVTATSINYDSQAYAYGCFVEPVPPPLATTISVTALLSNPVRDSDIYNDVCQNLLSTWNLEDDEQYPWRTDTFISVAPLVTRDEILFTDWAQPTTWVTKDYGTPQGNDLFSANPGATMPNPQWDGITGIANDGTVVPADVNGGSAFVAIDMTTFNGATSFDGFQVASPFPCGAPASYAITGGTLPPGVSFNAATGIFSGIVNGIPTGDPFDGNGKYGVTIRCTGPPCATGEIIGAPLPAGYGGNQTGYFQFGWLDYRGCCENDGTDPANFSWYLRGYGMSTGGFNNDVGCQIPLNATNWTNRWESLNKPQGAWLFYNDQSQIPGGGGCADANTAGSFNADALWACKYAEILDIWPSQNFARPGGGDKFGFDETQPVYAAVNLAGSGPGSTWNLFDANGNVPPDQALPGIWGGPVVDGFYSGNKYAGGVLTLGAKVYNAPSNWQSAAGAQSGGRADDSGVCIGMLRFPDAPSLLGRAAITPDAPGTTMSFGVLPSGGQPTFGMAIDGQETVDLWDKDINQIAAGVAATRIDDLHFTTPTAFPTAAYVTITGAPKWYMNDGDPKGDYALLEWNSDFRNQGEAGRLAAITDCSGANPPGPTANYGGGPVNNPFAAFSETPGCVPFSPCGPKVVCISPNGEFATPYKFPPMLDLTEGTAPSASPGSFYFDETFGSKWWGWFQVTMTDLLWQPPHVPVGIIKSGNPDGDTLAWKMDDFSCPTPCDPGEDLCREFEYLRYYRHEPQVETRLSVPCNYGQGQNECAPALPAGITIGWLSPVTNSGVVDIILPPTPPGVAEDSRPGTALTAWQMHFNICTEIAGNCYLNYVLPAC